MMHFSRANVRNILFIYYGHPNMNQWVFLDFATRRAKKVHPEAKIHVLTNLRIRLPGVVTHYDSNLPANYLAKLHIYEVLDEPFIYLDNDVYLQRPFQERHLDYDLPFLLFNVTGLFHYPTPMELPAGLKRYNSGIVYVPSPIEGM